MIVKPTLKLAVPFVLPYRCVSPACKRNMGLRRHITYSPSREETCPHCSEKGCMIPLAVIHLIQPSQFGIVKTSKWSEIYAEGDARQRFDFLCEKSKKGFKDLAKSPNQPRHYTSNPQAATCYYCLREYNSTNFPRGELVKEF